MRRNLVVGTRSSKLALWQAEYIAGRLKREFPGLSVTLRRFTTTGDQLLDRPLSKIGGKGLFTQELETAMLAGEVDIAVHSLKDLPVELPAGLSLAAVTARTDPGDALVSPRYGSIDRLPAGAIIGTSSLRRRAQLLYYRPDFNIVELRGNVDTRLRKLAEQELDAVVLAVAGLKRLGWEGRITQVLPPWLCLPAVGQGALAIEARTGDPEIWPLLENLRDGDTGTAVAAERAYLGEIDGGCQTPVGVYGAVADGRLRLTAVLLTPDGSRRVRKVIDGPTGQAVELGRTLAQQMLAAGGAEILAATRLS